MRLDRARHIHFACDIGIGLAGREAGSGDGIAHQARGSGSGAVAVHIDQCEFGFGVELLFFGLALNFDHGQHRCARRQLLDTAANGGQSGFVAGQQIPVKGQRYDLTAARAADYQRVANLRRGSPTRGRAIAMQHEIEIDPALLNAPVARGIVAHFPLGAGRKLRAIGAHWRQLLRGALGKEESLDMVGIAGRDKTGHVAFQTDTAHQRRDLGNRGNRQQAESGIVAHALDGAGVGSVLGHYLS